MSKTDDERSEKEIAKRRDEVLRRMLKSPPKPQKDYVGDSKKKPKDGTRKRQSRKVSE